MKKKKNRKKRKFFGNKLLQLIISGLFAEFLNSCFPWFSLGFCFSLMPQVNVLGYIFDRKAGCGNLNCKFLDDDYGGDDNNNNNGNNDNDYNKLYTQIELFFEWV